MPFSNYRKEIRRLNSKMLFYKNLYPNTIEISGNAYNTAAIRCGLLDEFYKELKEYTDKLPADLFKEIDSVELKNTFLCWDFGDEDHGWDLWGPEDEIHTTFAYFYRKHNNREKALNNTIEFYKNRTRAEWREGRRSFLGKLLLS